MKTSSFKKILLVEDDRFILGMYKEMFEKEGKFKVTCAEDGSSALKMARENIPDVILLDVVMPLMDGFETLQEIKKEDALKDVPVILLTNLGQKNDVEKGLKMGAADYMIKAHFNPSEVIEKIKSITKDN